MPQKQINSNNDKIDSIKNICNQALADIEKIKKERDAKIKAILKEIDNKQVAQALKDIKGSE